MAVHIPLMHRWGLEQLTAEAQEELNKGMAEIQKAFDRCALHVGCSACSCCRALRYRHAVISLSPGQRLQGLGVQQASNV